VLLYVLARTAQALVLPASSYAMHDFTEHGSHEAIQSSGDLSGARSGITGWVEYRADVGESGWYELRAHGSPPTGVEFHVDPDEAGQAPPDRYFFQPEGYLDDSPHKIGNVWLTAGQHRIRLTRYFWTGFPKVTAVELRRSRGSLVDALQVYFATDQRVFRAGECARVTVRGGAGAQGDLQISDMSADGSRTYGLYRIAIPAVDSPVTRTVELSCRDPGFHRLSFRIDGRIAAPNDLLPLSYQVIDTSRPLPEPVPPETNPLIDIDCVAQPPDYTSADGTQLRPFVDGAYRESGDVGWIGYQRIPEAKRSSSREPSWFAYALRGVLPQQRYRVEIDYADDAIRTFAVTWREPSPLTYAVATAVESGREYRLSNTMRTIVFHAWARAAGPRLVFMPSHDGLRAACLRIRVYLAGATSASAVSAPAGNRQFLQWYEEGENFTGLFGAPDATLRGMDIAIARWLQAASETGVNTLMPTAVIYNFAMYPSRLNRAFSVPLRDTLRILMLQAERNGMRVIPELHPRADELVYARDGRQSLKNLALSSKGLNNFMGPSGRNAPPYFNALDAGNQQWYIDAVRELAERYRDSPALQGVSLRFMTWANPALNNLVNLDWGYDDDTIARFRAETGSNLPSGSPRDAGRFKFRHDWLHAHEKPAWIRWRCAKITLLFSRLRDTLRAVRPDLRLYLHLFGPAVQTGPAGPLAGESAFVSQMKEAGLDLVALSGLTGLVIVNSTFVYGRGEHDGLFFNATRDPLLDPVAMGAPPQGPTGQWFVPTSLYLEAIPGIVPPEKLGLPASARETHMMSAASNPTGRQVLERFALLLAGTDTPALGDGGNNYTLGSPFVAEFAREFTKLPQVPFEQVLDAVDPVAIRALKSANAFMFYAVNRESYAVRVRIDLAGAEPMDIQLQPYELRVFTARPAVGILAVHVEVPEVQRERIAGRIEWTSRLLAGSVGVLPSGGDAQTLAVAVSAARRALERGHLWRARTIFETSAVLVAFRRVGCFPPDMNMGIANAAGCQH
jgi:hypothetical protein